MELQGGIQEAWEAAKEAFAEGREDYREAFWRGRELMGKDSRDAPRMKINLGTNAGLVRLRDFLASKNMPGGSDPRMRTAREEYGLGLKKTGPGITGQFIGTLGNDLVQDNTRNLYWLLNAPQAVVNVANELGLSSVNPDLYGADKVRSDTGDYLDLDDDLDLRYAYQEGYINDPFDIKGNRQRYDMKKGFGSQFDRVSGKKYLTQRRFDPGLVAALAVPSGLAMNAGLGLMNPLGGSGGYTATMPSEHDPTKTSNVVGEIAAKYILGRTGNLLPYKDFVKERPDVSKGEYQAYKAFKWDKEGDFDLTDGDFTIPTGVLKGTMDGIHGPELQLLGRSMPLNQALIPTAAAMGGTMIGAHHKLSGGKPIRRGMMGGMTGLALGGLAGYILEENRRRGKIREKERREGKDIIEGLSIY